MSIFLPCGSRNETTGQRWPRTERSTISTACSECTRRRSGPLAICIPQYLQVMEAHTAPTSSRSVAHSLNMPLQKRHPHNARTNRTHPTLTLVLCAGTMADWINTGVGREGGNPSGNPFVKKVPPPVAPRPKNPFRPNGPTANPTYTPPLPTDQPQAVPAPTPQQSAPAAAPQPADESSVFDNLVPAQEMPTQTALPGPPPRKPAPATAASEPAAPASAAPSTPAESAAPAAESAEAPAPAPVFGRGNSLPGPPPRKPSTSSVSDVIIGEAPAAPPPFSRSVSAKLLGDTSDSLAQAQEYWKQMHAQKLVSSAEMPPWICQHVTKGQNVLRVFFSSPFGGMEKEREILTRDYFPELRVKCEQHGLIFVPIDLRWGITEQDATDALVIYLCLHEIDRSDLFVGFYAQRYGWHGTNDQHLMTNYEKAKHKYPWIEQYREKSVTELEFLAGHFNCPEQKAATFFFRDPLYDADQRKICEATGDTKSIRKFTVESDAAKVMLDDLVDRCRQSPTCFTYPGIYKTPEEGAGAMFKALLRIITPRLQLAKWEKTAKFGDPEAAVHEVFRIRHCQLYLDGDAYFSSIAHACAPHPAKRTIAVIGDSGSGKTSLLANWISSTKRKDKSAHFLVHFVGCSPESTKLNLLLKRFITQLSKITSVDVPDLNMLELPQLKTKFCDLVDVVSKAVSEQVYILIDALDELEQDKEAHDLDWLPETTGRNVSIIISTRHPEFIPAQREMNQIRIGRYIEATLRAIIKHHLQLVGKELSEKQTALILSTPACSNPLYLLVLVTELCQFGDFFQLDAKISEYLSAKDTTELFQRVLARLESDFASEAGLVRDVFTTMVAAREGVTESELKSILQLSDTAWSHIRYSLDDLLVVKSNLLCPRRYQLLSAVRKSYFKTPQDEIAARLRIIDYFQTTVSATSVEAGEHVTRELPWLYQQVGDRGGLRACITDQRIFGPLCIELANGNYDLLHYWRYIGAPPSEVAEEYMRAIGKKLAQSSGTTEEIEDLGLTCLRIGQYFAEAGNAGESWTPLITAQKIYEDAFGKTDVRLLPVLNTLALTANSLRDLETASQMAGQALAISTHAFGPQSLEVANAQIALSKIFKTCEQYENAIQLVQEALQLYLQLLPKDHPDIAMACKNLASLMLSVGQLPHAQQYFERALLISEKSLGKTHPNTVSTCDSLGNVYLQMGALEQAEQMFQRAYSARLEKLGADHLETAETMKSLSLLAAAKGDFAGAEKTSREAMSIVAKNLGPAHVSLCDFLDQLADWKLEQDLCDPALELFRQSLAIKEQTFGPKHEALIDILFNMSLAHMKLNQFKQSHGLVQRAYEISLGVHGKDHPLTQEAQERAQSLKPYLK
eukprot:m.771189 g.771189  ORF g.771189 m.771189 type:complete len:1360 (+) comp59089_c0_seq3:331-4410(+)